MITITEENLETLEHCIDSNPAAYNSDKALEECIEFQEVLIKLKTKHPKNKRRPKEEEAIKEFGDVFYRGLIAVGTIFPNREVPELLEMISAHINKKLSRLQEFRVAGTYEGGL